MCMYFFSISLFPPFGAILSTVRSIVVLSSERACTHILEGHWVAKDPDSGRRGDNLQSREVTPEWRVGHGTWE